MKGIQRVAKARAQLVAGHPFYGVLALHLDMQATTEFPTMATDGRRLLVNESFADSLSDPELRGVLAHEVLHCAYSHHARRGARDPRGWNEAADYAINLDLTADGFKLPEGALLDSRYRGMSAESIYAARQLEQSKAQPQPGNGQPQAGQGSPQAGGNGSGQPQADQQDSGQPGAAGKPSGQPDGQGGSAAGQASGSGNGQPDGNGQPSGGMGSDPGRCGQVIDAAPEHDPAAQSEAAAEWSARAMQAAAIAKAQGAGRLPGGIARLVEELRRPAVDWREALRRFIDQSMSRDYSWSRPNRRHIAGGLYLPGMVSDACGRILVAVDTSGSIDRRVLAAFAAELQSILDDGCCDRLSVVYCDSEIAGHAEFERGDIIRLHPKGGGGTRFSPVMDWATMESDAACLVYLTDMICGDWGTDPGIPVVWAAYGTGGRVPPFGEVIPVDHAA